MHTGESERPIQRAAILPWRDRAWPIGPDERRSRIEHARALALLAGLDALLVTARDSLRYFTGIDAVALAADCGCRCGCGTAPLALLLPVRGDVWISSARTADALTAAGLMLPIEARGFHGASAMAAALADVLPRGATLAIDGVADIALSRALAAQGLVLADGTPCVTTCRWAKSPAEIALIGQAAAMALAVQHHAARALRPGVDAAEVERFIVAAHRAIGADGPGQASVAFADRGAGTTMADASHRILGERALVRIASACAVDGYHGAVTRTFCFGDPVADDLDRFAAVRAAQTDFAAPARQPGTVVRTERRIGLGLGPALPCGTIGMPMEVSGACYAVAASIADDDGFTIAVEDCFHTTETGPAAFTRPQPALDRPFD